MKRVMEATLRITLPEEDYQTKYKINRSKLRSEVGRALVSAEKHLAGMKLTIREAPHVVHCGRLPVIRRKYKTRGQEE